MQFFSKLDLEFIQRSLSRVPSKKELKIIHDVVEPILLQREKLSPRFVKQLQSKQNLVMTEIRDVTQEKVWRSPNFLLRDCALRRVWPSQLALIWLFKPPKTTLRSIHQYESNLTDFFKPSINHHISLDAPRKKSGKVIVMGLLPENTYENLGAKDQILGYVKIPKPGKTLMNEKRIMDVLSLSKEFVTGFSLNGTQGIDLRNLFKFIPAQASIDLSIPLKCKKGDGLVILNGVSDNSLKDLMKKYGYEYYKIGRIKSDNYHILKFDDEKIKKWPLDLMSISIHSKEKQNDKENSKFFTNRKTKGKKLSITKVVNEIIVAGYPKNESGELTKVQLGRIIKVATKQQILSSENTFFDGARSIANVVRKISAVGSDIQSIQILSNVNQMEYLDGQQSAIHAFDIKDKTEIHFINELEFNQHQVIGIGKTCSESNLDIQESDFISILGSLNGELKNSLYQDITGQTFDDNESVFDSTMEFNINKTLIQAINENIIKKVSTFSRGGLITALFDLYIQMNRDYGIRVHVSRKLLDQELLFGESFGAALVLVGEKELMEFQRICMIYGVPCSTIGRLHIKQKIKVNDILTVQEKALKSISC